MTTPISKQRLLDFLFDNGFADAYAPAQSYALPSARWIHNDFAAALYLAQQRDSLTAYSPGQWNCTNFSEHAKVVAAVCHLRTKDAPKNSALAFGVFDFVRADGSGHSVNIAVVRDREMNLGLVWFEPQECAVISTPKVKEGTTAVVRF